MSMPVTLKIDPALRPSRALTGVDELVFGSVLEGTVSAAQSYDTPPRILLGLNGAVMAHTTCDQSLAFTLPLTTSALALVMATQARSTLTLQVQDSDGDWALREVTLLRGAWDGEGSLLPEVEVPLAQRMASVDESLAVHFAADLSVAQSEDAAATASLASDLLSLSLYAAADALSLASLIDAEEGARSVADTSLDSAIDAETSRALAAEGGLGAEIDGEVSDRASADASLAEDLDGVYASLSNGLNAVANGLSADAVSRASVDLAHDQSLAVLLSSDYSASQSADVSLDAVIEALDGAFPGLSFCPDMTLAELAALTHEEAEARKIVRVTNGYTLQGDIGNAYAYYTGSAWYLMGGVLVPPTADRAAYDRALARNYSAFRSGRVRVTGLSGHSCGLPRPSFVNSSGSQGPGPGGFSINTSASASSYVYRSTYSGAIEVSENSYALEEVYWEAYAYVEALSTPKERYMARAGLEGNAATQYSYGLGATFYYDEGNIGGMGGSPYWQCVTRNNSRTPATTLTVTSVLPGIGQGMSSGRQRLGIRITATEVTYSIDDVVVATHTTSLPTGSGKRLQSQQAILKTVGTTSRYFGLDHEAVVEIFNTSPATA